MMGVRPQEETVMCWSSYDRRDRDRDRIRVADRAGGASRPTASPPPPVRDPDVRVSQAERDEVVNVLAGHYADGRLSLGEYEERVATALAATIGRDLDALFTDLPGGTPATAAATAPAPVAPAPTPAASARPAWASRRRPPVPLVFVVVALGIFVTPWAFFLLFPLLGGASHGGRHHHGHRSARGGWDGWDRDGREPVRML